MFIRIQAKCFQNAVQARAWCECWILNGIKQNSSDVFTFVSENLRNKKQYYIVCVCAFVFRSVQFAFVLSTSKTPYKMMLDFICLWPGHMYLCYAVYIQQQKNPKHTHIRHISIYFIYFLCVSVYVCDIMYSICTCYWC